MRDLVIIRGAGDIASGIAAKLFNAGFKIIMLEIAKPSSIRRSVSFSEAIYDSECVVEGIKARKASLDNALNIASSGEIAVLVDEDLKILKSIKAAVLVDAILAKKNLGTKIDMADIVISVGPGFYASKDAHAVIESARGHDLGKIIYEGFATPNTGVPGLIAGVSKDRVIYAKNEGKFKIGKNIADIVKKGEVIAKINEIEVKASIDGVLRGIIRDGFLVKEGLKIADIDPRIDEQKNCFSISDKARCIAGGVLEAILHLRR